MNAIVLVALRRPLTFVVMSILLILFGTMAVMKTPTDIFPAIRIPVIAVVWNYNGLSPQDMSGRVVYYYERALTATVANIEHIESQSLYGAGIVKIYFQPGTDIAAAQAQVTSALSLNGAYTFTEGAYNSANGSGNPHWHQGTLQGDYSLSKRTDVYLEGVYQHVSAPVGSVFSGAVINGLSPSTSNSQVAATVGIRHRF